MKRLTVSEHSRIPKRELGRQLTNRLYAFDLLHEEKTGARVFDWRYEKYIRTLSHVGVVQVPGISIEILPKVDIRSTDGDSHARTVELARRNFLFMISTARHVKLKPAGIASQASAELPVFESLVRQFASDLLFELRKGVSHAYINREDNLEVLKGRIRFPEQIRLNNSRRDRLYVEFDEFSIDTHLNRILKATCVLLARRVGSGRTRQMLQEILLELADVAELLLTADHFDRIHLTRESARFNSHISFCKLVFDGLTTTASHGEVETFGFLVPMNQLFEEFIGGLVLTHANHLGIDARTIHLQARNRRRWLLKNDAGKHAILLKPDIVIDATSGRAPFAIIDSKWKLVAGKKRVGVPTSDIYQMLAYSKRYRCSNNIFVLPSLGKAEPLVYRVVNDEFDSTMRVVFIDVSVDWSLSSRAILNDLALAFRVLDRSLESR